MKKGSKALKIFQTKSFFDDIQVSLYNNKLIYDDGFYPVEKSYKEVLYTDFFPISIDAKTEYEICLFACKQLKGKTGLSKGLKRCIEFYEYYDPQKVKAFSFKNEQADFSIKVSQQLELSPYGLEVWEYDKIKMLVKPDKLFFVGPYAKCLPLEIRTNLKAEMLNALGKQNKIKNEDGFPVLDYDAFEKEKYTWETGDLSKGAKLVLEKGCIYYLGWSSPREGGAQSFDMEWFLYYGLDYFKLITNRDFEDQYDAVCDILRIHVI